MHIFGNTALGLQLCFVMFQATIQSDQREGELRYKIAWSKVTKRHDAEPVLEPKDYSYLREMLVDVTEKTEDVSTAKSLNKGKQNLVVESKLSDTRHIMAPLQRPPRQDVINKRISLSRFKTKKDDA